MKRSCFVLLFSIVNLFIWIGAHACGERNTWE